MNLDGLVEMVASYTKRPDLTSQIRTYFIPLAEARIGRDLRSMENERYAEVTPVDAENGAELPADFGAPLAIHVKGNSWPLASTGPDSLKKWQSVSSAENPLFYYIAASKTDAGKKAVYTAPYNGAALEVSYYSRPELTDAANTNAVLDRYPQLYLYASMLELHVWEKNAEALATIQGSYTDEIGAINRDAERARGAKPAMEIV